MQDKREFGRIVSNSLDKCYFEYKKISQAPDTLEKLLNKYEILLPNFKLIPHEKRGEVQKKLDRDIENCRKMEIEVDYKSSDGTDVFLVKNPYIWPKLGKGFIRQTPKLLGPLVVEKKTFGSSKKVAFNYHSDDDLE